MQTLVPLGFSSKSKPRRRLSSLIDWFGSIGRMLPTAGERLPFWAATALLCHIASSSLSRLSSSWSSLTETEVS